MERGCYNLSSLIQPSWSPSKFEAPWHEFFYRKNIIFLKNTARPSLNRAGHDWKRCKEGRRLKFCTKSALRHVWMFPQFLQRKDFDKQIIIIMVTHFTHFRATSFTFFVYLLFVQFSPPNPGVHWQV